MYVVNQEGRKENDMFCLWEWIFIWLSSPFFKFYQGVLNVFCLCFIISSEGIYAKISWQSLNSLLFLYPQPFNYQFSIMRKYNPNFLCFTCTSKQVKMVIKSIHHFNGKLVAEKKEQENKMWKCYSASEKVSNT